MQETKFWSVKGRDWPTTRTLVNELGIAPLVAQLLVNRGIKSVEEARTFFEPSLESLNDLVHIPGCQEAAAIIIQAISRGEKMVVFGDYDADGVTAAALLVKGLRTAGGNVDYYIPDRFSEGYDLNQGFMSRAAARGYRLIITVDCGIRAFECINLARESGMQIIVTDHHQPADIVPKADAVINPKLSNNFFTKELAGVGVALALILTVWEQAGIDPWESNRFREMLDLATIGTISDSVSLLGCNRVIVRHGLKQLGETPNTGLSALFEVEGLQNKKEFEVTDVSFKIGPCINAVGRIGDANEAVALLISESPQEAWELAKKLHKDNTLRQTLDGAVYLEATEIIEQEVDLSREKVIVLASDNWHPGVIGITASRIVQKFYRPAVLISVEAGIGKGSGRSLGGFNLIEAFKFCSDHLLKFGGHKQAGGFSIAAEQINDFRRCINQYALECCESTECFDEADAEVFLQDMDVSVIEELDKLKPFGPGNPVPLFICRNVHIEKARNVGKKNEHLKLVVSSMETEVDCIGFRLAEKISSLKQGDCADLLFSPQINEWNGTRKVQLLLSDVGLRNKNPRKIFTSCQGARQKTAFIGDSSFVEYMRSGERVQYCGLDGEEQLLSALLSLKRFNESSVKAVVLFPLHSAAVDFQRRVAEVCPGLRIASIDCVTPDEDIARIGNLLKEGSVDLLVTSIGTWKSNENLLEALGNSWSGSGNGSIPYLCIHLGHWGTMFPGIDLIEDAREILQQWSSPALVIGSGVHFTADRLAEKTVESDNGCGNNGFKYDYFSHSPQDKLQAICDICSVSEKSLVFVNSGREAIRLSRELAEIGCLQPVQVRGFHGGLLPGQKKLILEDFNCGTSKVLVASRNLETSAVENADAVVIYVYPLNVFDFNRFLVAPNVHLTYNDVDFEKSSAYVHSLCPNDGILEYVAKNLRYSGNADIAELHHRLSRGLQGSSCFSRRALSVALAIFFTLGLNEAFTDPIPLAKTSWRYLEAKKEVEAFNLLKNQLSPTQSEVAATFDI